MGELQNEAFAIVKKFRDYLDRLPLLKFHDNYKIRDYDIDPLDWVEYINLMEREKNLYIKKSQEEKEISEFNELINRLSSQYA